ncbi:MAG: hypothetical protein PHQ60_12730 [Sideroxydans sp.]|nr:hypothetical protein [Sideroxydans sp.]
MSTSENFKNDECKVYSASSMPDGYCRFMNENMAGTKPLVARNAPDWVLLNKETLIYGAKMF